MSGTDANQQEPPTVLYCAATSDDEAQQKLTTLIRYARTRHPVHTGVEADTLAGEVLRHDSIVTTIYADDENDVPTDVIIKRPDRGDRGEPDAVRRLAATPDLNRVIVYAAHDTTLDLLKDINCRDVQIHLVIDGLVIEIHSPVENTVGTALRTLTGDPPDAEDLLSGVSWDGGRPPFGTTSEHGELRPDDQYDEVRRQLRRVRRGVTSKRAAARKLSCAPSTIDAALKRPSLYGLDDGDE